MRRRYTSPRIIFAPLDESVPSSSSIQRDYLDNENDNNDNENANDFIMSATFLEKNDNFKRQCCRTRNSTSVTSMSTRLHDDYNSSCESSHSKAFKISNIKHRTSIYEARQNDSNGGNGRSRLRARRKRLRTTLVVLLLIRRAISMLAEMCAKFSQKFHLNIFSIFTLTGILLFLLNNTVCEARSVDLEVARLARSLQDADHTLRANVDKSHAPLRSRRQHTRRRHHGVEDGDEARKERDYLQRARRERHETVVVDDASRMDDVTVTTKQGRIRGFQQKFENTLVDTFLGVPYALKPVGARRFRVPEPTRSWDGEFVATTPSRTCVYTIDTMFPQFPGAEMWNPPNELSEDCLSVNIWAPAEKEQRDGTVLVWIYGGGFFSGSPSLELYDGRVLAARERVIVVNINYRLGPFGFLYFGPGSPAPGNMGLMDQQLALKWIHENIIYFGGDPRKVTLFGESAGGASVSAHLFAPASRNYFSRLIIKSGTILNNWATKSKQTILDISLTLAQRLNCTTPSATTAAADAASANIDALVDRQLQQQLQEQVFADRQNVERVIECLSNVSAFSIQREANVISESLTVPMTFAFVPIDDDENFFQENLFEKVRRRDFKKDVTVILGSVKDEGTYWLPYYLHKYGFGFNHTISAEDRNNQALITESDYTRAFDAFLPYFGDSPLVRHALMHAYARVEPPSSSNDVHDDRALIASQTNHQHHLANHANVQHQYHATPRRPSSSLTPGADADAYHRYHETSDALGPPAAWGIAGSKRWRDGIARFLGDYFFTCALVDFADILADNIFGAVFMYYFTKRSSANPWPRWMGVMHGYEIEYVFGLPFRQAQQYAPDELDAERQFSEMIMEFWSRFARTGEPVEYWPKYNRITRKSLVLSDEISRGNSHRIYMDVHGRLCRLLGEAQTVSANAVRRRTAGGAVSLSSLNFVEFGAHSSSSSAPTCTSIAIVVVTATAKILMKIISNRILSFS